MKKLILFLGSTALMAVLLISCQKETIQQPVTADLATEIVPVRDANGCNTIPSGLIVDSSGNTVEVGYNDFGYNYQAHIYNGDYGYPGWKLIMKWNDAWLSNKDCDGDGLLDRPLDENGNQYYFGSGAWLTNHWTTTYDDGNGNICVYDDFIKIVALPIDAVNNNGVWYTADGTEIGPDIWGQFAIIQSVINDPCAGVEGLDYKSPDHPGLGNW